MSPLKLYLLIISALLPGLIAAQSLARHAFVSGGESSSTNGYYLSWTLGQAGLSGTLPNNEMIITAGFQQGDTIIITGIRDASDQISLKVFPNPFKESFRIALDAEFNGAMTLELYDFSGKKVLKIKEVILYGSPVVEEVHAADLPRGLYTLYIHLTTDKSVSQNIPVKLIKY